MNTAQEIHASSNHARQSNKDNPERLAQIDALHEKKMAEYRASEEYKAFESRLDESTLKGYEAGVAEIKARYG